MIRSRQQSSRHWHVVSVCALAAGGCLAYPPAPHPCAPVPGAIIAPGVGVAPGGTAIQPTVDPLFSGPSQPAVSAAPALRIRAAAPADAAVGALMGLRLEISNVGGSAAKDVNVVYEVPASLAFVGSQPEPEDDRDATLEWRLGDVPAGKTITIDANLRIEQPGQVQQCATATAADGVTARQCVVTNVASPRVTLRVTGPKEAAVGDSVTFEITAENRSNLPATGLQVTARFDDGLIHASGEQALLKDLEDLSPGQSRTIGITLEVTRTGTLCNEVELTGGGGLRETAQSCTEAVDRVISPPGRSRPQPETPIRPDRPEIPAVPPRSGKPASVAVKLKGPATALVGGIAEFFVDVTNNSDAPLTNVNIAAAFDRSFVPVKADAGHTVDEQGRLVWNYPSMQPGKALRLRVQCRCEEKTAKACGLASVTCDEKATAESEACLRLEMPSTELSVNVTDLHDPIEAGKEMAYEIRVTNLGPAADRQVVVSFTVPQGMTLVPLGTMGPEGFRGFVEIQPPTWRFIPLADLPLNKTQTWVVRVQADKPGDVVFKARVDSNGSDQPIDAEQRTKIVPQ